ncbi:unnamed protein product [Closterium sp. NIES-53]
MEGQDNNYATTSDIASLRTDMERTQAALRRLEAFQTSQPGFATAAAATTATAAPTTPAAVATLTFHGPMAPLSPNLEAARPRLPEAFDPSAKGSDVRPFVATLEIYFEAIGYLTPQHDATRIWLAATLNSRAARNGYSRRCWFQGRQLPPPPPVLVQDEPEYEVEHVLAHWRRGGKTLDFLLRWKGYDPTEDSWVVEADMGNARRALKDYLVKQDSRLLSTAFTDPSFESSAGSALVAELLDFPVACRLDYATALVAEAESASPPSVGDKCALSTDVIEDRHEDFECLIAAVPRFASMLLALEGDPDAPDIPTPRSYSEAITCPYSSQWQATMDAEMASWKSTGTCVDKVSPPGANIVNGMWIFRGVDYFQTFSPTSKMTTLWVLLHVAAQRDYELHSLDFSTAFLQSSLHEEIGLRRPPSFTRSTTVAALGFAPSTADPSLFLRTDTKLPPFYVLVYVDDLVFATADTEALALVKSEVQKRHICTDLGPSAIRLPILLATAHSSVYRPLLRLA